MHKMCICSQPFNLVFLLQLGPHLPISEFALDKKFQCICFKIGHIFYGIYEKTKLLFPFCFSYFPANKWSMGIEYVDQAQGFHQGLKLFTGNYHQSSTNSEFGGLGPYKFVLLCKCEEKGSDNKYRSGCFSLLLGKNGTIFAPSDNDDGIQPHQK